MKLRIVSCYLTVDGECTDDGPLQWSTFIRTGGCNLRCWKSSGFCDAPQTLDITHPYREFTVEQLLEVCVNNLPCERVTITGGEPLIQYDGVIALAKNLSMNSFRVSLETSGSKDMFMEDRSHFASIVADLKPPSTEMSKYNCFNFFEKLRPQDYIKVVLENRDDYVWSLAYLNLLENLKGGHPGFRSPRVAFGPRWGYLQPRVIADWLKNDKRFDIMLNMQIHKYIWPEARTAPVKDLKALFHDTKLLQYYEENER
jgi:7-carboxy-7-deazaguanine synthase